MKRNRASFESWRRTGLAALAGLLWALAFPAVSWNGLAWVAPALLLMSAMGTSGGRAFRLGYLGGFIQALVSLYWLLLMPFPWGALAGWAALSAYMALYPALWVWLSWRSFPGNLSDLGRLDESDEREEAGPKGIGGRMAERFLAAGWHKRLIWSIQCAALWVALEMIVGRLMTGFPWNFIGVSQYSMLPLIQVASWAGVYGVSFIVVWTSVAIGCAVVVVVQRPNRYWAWTGELILPFLVLIAVVYDGIGKLTEQPGPAPRSIQVALIQPSIPQTLIWDSSQNAERFKKTMELTRTALETEPDLLVWPESSLPNLEPEQYAALRKLIARHEVWMILGGEEAVPRSDGEEPSGYDIYNSAYLVTPRGRFERTYRKQHLVIFGEYVPLVDWFPFLKHLTPIQGGFSVGTGPAPFHLPSLDVRTSALICFEDVIPHLARRSVFPNTDFLLNLTNDGWFGESAAQWQHAVNALFRAVENGVPLVRCTNNGLTCWIDRFGRMNEVDFEGTRDVYAAGFKTARVPVLPPGEQREPTFYRRHGDWFGWGCMGFAGVLIAVRIGLNKKSRQTGRSDPRLGAYV